MKENVSCECYACIFVLLTRISVQPFIDTYFSPTIHILLIKVKNNMSVKSLCYVNRNSGISSFKSLLNLQFDCKVTLWHDVTLISFPDIILCYVFSAGLMIKLQIRSSMVVVTVVFLTTFYHQEHTTMCLKSVIHRPSSWLASCQLERCFMISNQLGVSQLGTFQLVCNLIVFSSASWEYSSW